MGKPIRQWMLRLCAGIMMTVLLAGVALAEDTQDKPVWLVIGDSISEHNFHSEHNYDEYVSAMLDVDVVNVATGGTGYLKPTAITARGSIMCRTGRRMWILSPSWAASTTVIFRCTWGFALDLFRARAIMGLRCETAGRPRLREHL